MTYLFMGRKELVKRPIGFPFLTLAVPLPGLSIFVHDLALVSDGLYKPGPMAAEFRQQSLNKSRKLVELLDTEVNLCP